MSSGTRNEIKAHRNEFRRRNPGATVLTSLTAGTNALAFVEFRPGLTGVVESGPAGQPSKIDALRGRALEQHL